MYRCCDFSEFVSKVSKRRLIAAIDSSAAEKQPFQILAEEQDTKALRWRTPATREHCTALGCKEREQLWAHHKL